MQARAVPSVRATEFVRLGHTADRVVHQATYEETAAMPINTAAYAFVMQKHGRVFSKKYERC